MTYRIISYVCMYLVGLISVQCVALRNLDLLIKTGWSVIFSFFC